MTVRRNARRNLIWHSEEVFFMTVGLNCIRVMRVLAKIDAARLVRIR